MSKILYLHGFASCGNGNKSTTLKSHFGEALVVAPDLPVAPDEAIPYIVNLCETEDITLLIGSSLGGFYATVTAEHTGIPAVLLNPSVEPWKTLVPYVGENQRFCDNSPFHFDITYLEQLGALSTHPVKSSYLVLLQSGDEVLDYKVALGHYDAHKVIVEYGGNHRFENISDYLCMIETFREQQ